MRSARKTQSSGGEEDCSDLMIRYYRIAETQRQKAAWTMALKKTGTEARVSPAIRKKGSLESGTSLGFGLAASQCLRLKHGWALAGPLVGEELLLIRSAGLVGPTAEFKSTDRGAIFRQGCLRGLLHALCSVAL